jgi:PAS domain S-box-containing protein
MAQETREQLLEEIASLRTRLNEAQETLEAIRSGAVDALVIDSPSGPQVYTLEGAQHPYRIIVETMNEGSVTIGQDGVILYCNTRFAEMAGCPLQKAIGASFLRFVAPGFRQGVAALLDSLQAQMKTEVTLIRPDGNSLPVLLSASPMPTDYGLAGHILVVTDMSAQKQTEEKLRQYAEQNARMSRELGEYAGSLEERVRLRTAELEEINNELEAFTYTVSHDLRAPLHSIAGFAQILARSHRDQLDEKGQLYLDKIIENAADMDELMTSLLTLSRHHRAPVRKRVVDPAELARQALRDLQTEAQEGRLEIRIDAMPRCRADPVLLKQVYVNLLSNAIKFSARRSPAVIQVGCLEPAANGSEEAQSGVPVYFVQDNGVGLKVDNAPQLFGVFRRYHSPKEYPGAGVGLAIVQRIIRRHGGRVWVRSEEDQGATFYFTLQEESSNL